MFDIKGDHGNFTLRMAKLRTDVKATKKLSLFDIANEILRLSQAEVPLDKGTLQNSGNVEDFGDYMIIGYHTPYAARLHEHPEYHFQRGRKGKYLEDPIIRNQAVLGIKLNRTFLGALDARN